MFARVRIAYQPPRVPAAALVVDQVVHRPAVVKARLVGDLPDGLITLNGSVLGELDPDSQWLCHYVSSISVNRSNTARSTGKSVGKPTPIPRRVVLRCPHDESVRVRA
jgi:hypothetical protein